MAHLNKLAIRGIRSFDDKQISIIEFFSPVTVIVGHNGSGKTTIIECLKYATTGDQPPNTRGGAFIHDPKMANEKEVKAQVKLRFHAANGTRMLAVRNLSVTVKKTSRLTMKTLESILAVADDNGVRSGKRNVISTKCAEMDIEIPQLLGVSKSVLENVIFCHQEDSYWPLAEPAALKKKFDDIFEATRYTKALDSIKNLRKERLADLKADKETLLGYSREKAHSDKLKTRIADMKSDIASKEVEYDETKAEYEKMAEANRMFYEYATKFRETYMVVKALQEKKSDLESDLNEAKLNLKEIQGTEEELNARLTHFDEHINFQKQSRRRENDRKQELEDDLAILRKQHTELITQHGGLQAEAEAQKQRIADRETLIHEISKKYGIKGFDYSPLEGEKVVEFMSRLGDLERKRKSDLERLQADLQAQNDEYNRKVVELHNVLESHKLQKTNLRKLISERQNSISSADRKLEQQQNLSAELRSIQADIYEKKSRLEKIKSDVSDARYDLRLSEKADKSRSLEAKREELLREFSTLNHQSDTTVKLSMQRGQIKGKSTEIQNILTTANLKFRKLVDRDLSLETAQSDIEKISLEKEKEQANLEDEYSVANNSLQQTESTVKNLKKLLETKTNEMKALSKRLRSEVEQETLEIAIKEATIELDHRKNLDGSLIGTSGIYENLLKAGKQKKVCTACNRHLDDHELIVFEKYLKDQMKKSSPEAIENNKQELKEWEEELDRLQNLRPVQVARDQLKFKEIPALEKQVQEQESLLPDLTKKAEEVTDSLDSIKRQLKDIFSLKQDTTKMTGLQKEIDKLKQEITELEASLSTTGSTRTPDDIQLELDELSVELRSTEREKQAITLDKERQNTAIHSTETSLHQMELKERDLTNALREKTTLEESLVTLKAELISYTSDLKSIDDKISEAQTPIQNLEGQHQDIQNEFSAKISQAQGLSQEINSNVDKLNNHNKGVQRYVKDRRARALDDLVAKIDQHDGELQALSDKIESVREAIRMIDSEINESGNSVTNLRENIRVRKLARNISDTQAEIEKYDMDEAAKARRNFNEKYGPAKEKENQLHAAFSHMAGELSSRKAQLQTLEKDLKEFKDINMKYTNQLVKVKVSDMANTDLEKYAKALDNAIMKYHGLKMEEVNDTMKHLWNKTYQGTDIDGIKIRSDVEGGASKRSYNYRVVMTKDQVEMDMRGRCSAGQKMLASIIIRLALSDSFGQNCGILALDEPTNALDTENIDALAASLVDIINERKSHSNFQLIIITHDENFLRKLGQSDVMEYYWRVSRDARQKSFIERQRFR